LPIGRSVHPVNILSVSKIYFSFLPIATSSIPSVFYLLQTIRFPLHPKPQNVCCSRVTSATPLISPDTPSLLYRQLSVRHRPEFLEVNSSVHLRVLVLAFPSPSLFFRSIFSPATRSHLIVPNCSSPRRRFFFLSVRGRPVKLSSELVRGAGLECVPYARLGYGTTSTISVPRKLKVFPSSRFAVAPCFLPPRC